MSRTLEARRAACELVCSHREGLPTRRPFKGAMRHLHRLFSVGRLPESGWIVFDDQDVAICRQTLEQLGIDPAIGPAPSDGASRIETAGFQSDEKTGAGSIAQTSGLFAVIPVGCRSIRIAAQVANVPVPGSYLVMPGETPADTDADWVLTIENYAAFLAYGRSSETISALLPGAGLLVLRTSPAYPTGARWAAAVRKHAGIHHCHAPDLDWAGLQHVSSVGADSALLPRLSTLEDHVSRLDRGVHTRQAAQRRACLRQIPIERPALAPWADWLARHDGGLMQEAMIAHAVPMQLTNGLAGSMG